MAQAILGRKQQQRPAHRKSVYMPEFLVLVPARAGSKGIPNKNLLTVAGIPLVGKAIREAKLALPGRSIFCSSEDVLILETAMSFGAEAHHRPNDLALDDSLAGDVIREFIESRKLGDSDVLVYLQPSSPFRSAMHISEAVQDYLKFGQPVVSFTKMVQLPSKFLNLEADGRLSLVDSTEAALSANRQSSLPLVYPNGAIYIFSVAHFKQAGTVPINGSRGYQMSRLDSVDLDDEEDVELMEQILRGRVVI